MGRRRRALTLIELFICLTILVIIGSLTILKGWPMVKHSQFKNSIARLEQELEWSRKTALSAQAEIHVILKQKNGKLKLIRHTDEPLRYRGGNMFCTLDQIPCFAFEGKKQENLHLVFTRTGWLQEPGELTIFSSDLKPAYTLELPPKNSPRITAKREQPRKIITETVRLNREDSNELDASVKYGVDAH